MSTFIVKAVVKFYFLGALAVSFIHYLTAGQKVGLVGWQSWVPVLAVDGFAVIGIAMQSKTWDDGTNKLGRRIQLSCGALSLVPNVYAGNTVGERIVGVLVPVSFIASELLVKRMRTRKAADAEAAQREAEQIVETAQAWMAACTHPTKCTSREQCERKTVARAKASKTVARKARAAKAEQRVLESMMA